MEKTGQQLKQEGLDLLSKVKRTSEDEQEAIGYLNQAIESEELYGTQLSDCFIKIGEVYRDRSTKTQENYNKALEFLTKSTRIKGLPTWFTPHNQVERLALCPEIFGFDPKWKDRELAWEMHSENINRQNGGDLSITALDWFGHLEKASGEFDPEWVKVGFDYVDKAIKRRWDKLWTSVMFTTYGRGYKYHSEKTADNFAKAKEWFEKSIELDVDANDSDQPWSIIGRGTARAYFELAELLRDPARFGFSESLKDAVEGRDKFNHGKAHLSKYGSLGPYSILESMFVNVWEKSLLYKRTQEDLETIKELCEFGRQIGDQNNKDSALYLFEGVARHAVNDKSDANYCAIVENYYNCLESCDKKGEGNSWMAEQAAKWAVPIVLDCGSEGFESSARDLESAQKLQTFLHQISKNPKEFNFSPKVREIIDVYAKSQKGRVDLYDPKKDE